MLQIHPFRALLAVLLLSLGGWVGSPSPLRAQAGSGEPPRPLTLAEALDRALEGNRELGQARAGLAEADGQVREAWGNVWPRIELSTNYSRNLKTSPTFLPAILFDPTAPPDELVAVRFGADNLWNNTISVEQPLFEARAFIGVGAAAQFRSLQEETVRGASLEVVTRIRVLFYDLLLVQEQARLTERSLARVREALEESRALNRAGLASDYDVLRLEVELANLEPQLRRARNQALQKERELVTELNFPSGTKVEVVGSLAEMRIEDPAGNSPENRELLEMFGPLPSLSGENPEVEALLERAREGNSRYLQSTLMADLRRVELRAEQAEFLPKLSLFGNHQVVAQQDGSPQFFGTSDRRGTGSLFGVQLTLPIFTGFQRMARVDQRRAGVRMAELEVELQGDRLRDDLFTFLEQVEEARLRARGQELAVEHARRGYDIASAHFREGMGSQLELTDAEVALRQSEFNYAEAVFEYLSGRARLDELVGEVSISLPVRGR